MSKAKKAAPLRKSAASSKRGDRPKRRLSVRRGVLTGEALKAHVHAHHPELTELPFVRFSDKEIAVHHIDYWAVPPAIRRKRAAEMMGHSFLGMEYALLTARFMERHWDRQSVLLNIVDAIARKNAALWTDRRGTSTEETT
jgi:hypothetical protein